MNKVILVGNLTRDPELTTTNSGVSVCRFSIAVQRRFANADNGPQADFFNIVVWRNQAENCSKFLKKGSKCGVVGRLQNSSYEASDGTKRYATDIVADEVEFLNSRNSDSSDVPSMPSSPKPQTELEPIDDDSLPF
mgnify:FL=1